MISLKAEFLFVKLNLYSDVWKASAKFVPFGLIFAAIEMKLTEASQESYPGLPTIPECLQNWDINRPIEFPLSQNKIKAFGGWMSRKKW